MSTCRTFQWRFRPSVRIRSSGLGITNMENYFRSIPSLSLIDGGGYQKHMIIRGRRRE